MKKLLFGLMLLVSMSSFADVPNAYNFKLVGNIRMENLEKAMSPGFSYAEVKITSIRKELNEYNPFKLLLGGNYDGYVIEITLNGEDKAECELTNILDTARFMVTDCESDTASVDHSDFIYYKDLGVELNIY